MRSNPHKLRTIASKYGWKEVQFDPDVSLIAFKRGQDERINIWYNRITVGTSISHPKSDKKQLFRREVDDYLVEKIFRNPRCHTNKGYSIKTPRNRDRWQKKASNNFSRARNLKAQEDREGIKT